MVRHPRASPPQPGEPGKWLNTAEGWARANVLYDKTSRPPKAGSLQEALFLHVWLKREEAKLALAQMLGMGLRQLTNAAGAESEVPTIFKNYLDALFPFYAEQRSEQDQKMVETMKKEVSKGPIQVNPIQSNVFQRHVKQMSLPDDFKDKLRKRKNRKV